MLRNRSALIENSLPSVRVFLLEGKQVCSKVCAVTYFRVHQWYVPGALMEVVIHVTNLRGVSLEWTAFLFFWSLHGTLRLIKNSDS